MNYDKIIEHVGETSKWNLINLGLLWLPPIMGGIIVLQTSFTGLHQNKHNIVNQSGNFFQLFLHPNTGVKCPVNGTMPRIMIHALMKH